ncbi:MAG: transcription termination/antitermination protein NusG [Chloroflexi bacterium]|nr:MAG: transcription termination/antitermination protein NusG [Chloroflexota bacterium]RLT52776.1 MAG: transcription termination/antitermination protein NusG [Chloroflexota bacterium]
MDAAAVPQPAAVPAQDFSAELDSPLEAKDVDFDVDFDDSDLGPSLAEQLAAVTRNLPALPLVPEEPPVDAEHDDELAPAIEPDTDRRWYVVHCYSGYENKVRHNLEQRIDTMNMQAAIFDIIVPTEEEIEVRDGKRKTFERRVFPGYVLVQMAISEESWFVVRNTPGVTGFVGLGTMPTPLPDKEVARILKRMEADSPRVMVSYKVGQKVRIIDGPFNDFMGTVNELDSERSKVRVMVSFFGRETPIELDFLQVEKL